MTRAHAGFTGVVQHEWLRPRGWVAPERVAAMGIDSLPGVGAALAKRLRALGIETVLDLLSTGHGATSSPSTRSRSRSSGATRKSRSRASCKTCAHGGSAAGARS